MQRDYWYSAARSTRLLEDPVAIGQEAARRALRRLGARQAKTQQAPVVFSPEIARSIVGNIFDAANGDAIYRHASFFAGMLGERVAGENVTVIDDGTLVFDRESAHDGSIKTGGFGTAPFDGEGLPTRRTVLVENGILRSYVTNTYTARKLGLATPPATPRARWPATPASARAIFSLSPARSPPNRSSPM